MAERIQLRRTRGWRKPDGAVVVARPSRWGNPWVVHQHGAECAVRCPTWSAPTPAAAVMAYRHAIQFPLTGQPTVPDPDTIRRELAGRDLACWCALDQPCHADVLLELAAAPAASAGPAVGERMAAIGALIRGHRYVYASEVELQEQLAGVLTTAGLPVRREARLSDRDRIDLLVGDVGIEVKVKGQRTPLAQLARYAEHREVAGLLLVTTRAAAVPSSIDGKPVAVVSLITNGLA